MPPGTFFLLQLGTLLLEDLNRKYLLQFHMNTLQKPTAQPVRSAETDYSPLRCQLGCNGASSRGAGRVLPTGTSVTKHAEKLPSSIVIDIGRTERQKR